MYCSETSILKSFKGICLDQKLSEELSIINCNFFLFVLK